MYKKLAYSDLERKARAAMPLPILIFTIFAALMIGLSDSEFYLLLILRIVDTPRSSSVLLFALMASLALALPGRPGLGWR